MKWPALLVLTPLAALVALPLVFAEKTDKTPATSPPAAGSPAASDATTPTHPPSMKSTASSSSSTPAAASDIDCTSACGLPSKVIIDMSKATVRKTDAEWKKVLTPTQFRVARQQGTEPPFQNEFYNNHADGVYFSICSDTPLFDSRDKFESGTGWPSFTKSIEPAFIVEQTDSSYGMTRTEVHVGPDGAHLGHVFPDGPAPTYKRYCINSASLRFVPRKEYDQWVEKQKAAAASPAANAAPTPASAN